MQDFMLFRQAAAAVNTVLGGLRPNRLVHYLKN